MFNVNDNNDDGDDRKNCDSGDSSRVGVGD